MNAKPWDPKPGSADLLHGIGEFRPTPSAKAPARRSADQQTGSLRDAIREFNATTPILDLFGDSVKRVSSTNGGEFAGPCPLCQGTDRLRAWPTPHSGPGTAWCRRCNTSGDALHWSMRIGGRDTSARGAVAAYLVERGFLAARDHAPRTSASQHSNAYAGAGAAAIPPVPVAPEPAAPTLDAASPKVRALFAAWDAVLGYAPCDAPAAIQAAKQHAVLHAALVAVAPAGQDIDRRWLDKFLASLSGIAVNDHQIVRAGGEGDEPLWRYASTWSLNLSKARTPEMFKTEEDWA